MTFQRRWRRQRTELFETEFTLVGISPLVGEFTELAKQLRLESEEHASQAVRQLAAAVGR
jgi:hypothetical protein